MAWSSESLREYVIGMNAMMKQLDRARMNRRAEIHARYRFRRLLTRLVPYHCSCCLEHTAIVESLFPSD